MKSRSTKEGKSHSFCSDQTPCQHEELLYKTEDRMKPTITRQQENSGARKPDMKHVR